MVTFDPASLTIRVAELEEELGQPGFWDEPEHAAAVSAEHSRLAKRLERYDRLTREYDDARELLELDASLADEVAASIVPLRRELERLQEDALFSGEYDGGDAVVMIQADAGGTDAQDWAEMLLRMYLRWAADRGFKTEMLDTSPGRSTGSSRRRSRSRATTRTGSSRPSAASTASCARARSTRRTAATRASGR